MIRRLARASLLAGLLALSSAFPAPAATLLSLTITTAVSAQVSAVQQLRPNASSWQPGNILLQCNLTYGSGGTTIDAWVQTSVDGGTTWVDVANCHFTTSSLRELVNVSALTPITAGYTATDGSLAANTAKDGIVGSHWRVKYTTVGTYAASTTLVVSLEGVPLASTTSP